MKFMNIKSKNLLVGSLAVSYWLFRFMFFEMHGMKVWPNTLAMAGLSIILLANLFGKRIIPVATLVGYIGGFILAMIFNTDGVDPGGGLTNNAWIIWGTIFIFSIVIGIILNLISDKKHKSAKS